MRRPEEKESQGERTMRIVPSLERLRISYKSRAVGLTQAVGK